MTTGCGLIMKAMAQRTHASPTRPLASVRIAPSMKKVIMLSDWAHTAES